MFSGLSDYDSVITQMNHIEPHRSKLNGGSKKHRKNKKSQRMTKPALTFIVFSCNKYTSHTFQAVTITFILCAAA